MSSLARRSARRENSASGESGAGEACTGLPAEAPGTGEAKPAKSTSATSVHDEYLLVAIHAVCAGEQGRAAKARPVSSDT